MDGGNPRIAQVTVCWQPIRGASWLFEKRIGRRWVLCDGMFADSSIRLYVYTDMVSFCRMAPRP